MQNILFNSGLLIYELFISFCIWRSPWGRAHEVSGCWDLLHFRRRVRLILKILLRLMVPFAVYSLFLSLTFCTSGCSMAWSRVILFLGLNWSDLSRRSIASGLAPGKISWKSTRFFLGKLFKYSMAFLSVTKSISLAIVIWFEPLIGVTEHGEDDAELIGVAVGEPTLLGDGTSFWTEREATGSGEEGRAVEEGWGILLHHVEEFGKNATCWPNVDGGSVILLKEDDFWGLNYFKIVFCTLYQRVTTCPVNSRETDLALSFYYF